VLAGIQGSGWGWLVKKDGELAIVTTPVLTCTLFWLMVESRPCDGWKGLAWCGCLGACVLSSGAVPFEV